MSMKKILLAGFAGTLLAGSAMAAEPMTLTDSQLDGVSAGATLVAGIALVGPFQALGGQSLSFTDLSQVATVEQFAGNPTSVQSLYQTQAAAGLQASHITNSPGGAAFLSGGTFALGGSVTFP